MITERASTSGLHRWHCSGWLLWLPLAALSLLSLDLHAQYAGGEGRGDDMAESVFTPCSVLLPVELLYFNASCKDGLPLLEWATATERNSAAFMVERSTGTTGWAAIGSLPAVGQSITTVRYAFVDKQPPLSSVIYYRLRQQDTDGSTTILPVVAVESCSGTGHGLVVYPNPADDVVWVETPAVEEFHWLELTEATGRMVQRKRLAPSASHRTEELVLVGLSAGVYQLSLRDEQGSRLAWTKIMKR